MANEIKSEQLGMAFGTAGNRLRKQLMFELVVQAGRDTCYRCGEPITCSEHLSIDHKEPWQDSDDPPAMFFDLENVTFSHLACNIGAGRRKAASHPSWTTYENGCRCEECRAFKAAYQQKYRNPVA